MGLRRKLRKLIPKEIAGVLEIGAPIAAATFGGPTGALVGATMGGLGSLKRTGSFSPTSMAMGALGSAGPDWWGGKGAGGMDRGTSYLKSMWSEPRPWLGKMSDAAGAKDYSIAGKLGSMIISAEGAVGIGLGVIQYIEAKKQEAKDKGLGYSAEDYEADVAEYYEAYQANFEKGFAAKGGRAGHDFAKGGIASLRKGGRAGYAFGKGPVLSELLEIQEEPPIGDILTETGILVDEQVKGPGPGIEGISTEGIEGHTASSRIGDLMRLLEEAISQNNTDKANEIRSDLYREFGIRMKKGGRVGYDTGSKPTKLDQYMQFLTAKLMKDNPKWGKDKAKKEATNYIIKYKSSLTEKEKTSATTGGEMPLFDKRAQGGRIRKAPGGLMNLGGMEKDYRTTGGFVPIGKKEKADDVPARLSKNEFVMTADAVRAAGGGNINKGAQKMYNTMKQLEGKVA
jgi:hypothetical protein